MSIFRTALTAAGVGLALGATPALADVTDPPQPPPPDVRVVEGRALVRFLPGTDEATRTRAFAAARVTVSRTMGLENAFEVSFPESRDPRVVSRELGAQPGVKWAEPDVYGEVAGWPLEHASVDPLDPLFGDQWGLENAAFHNKDIDADRAWGITEGNPGPVVAVIDSGVVFDHPDLAGVMHENPGESPLHLRANGKDDDGNGYVDDWHGYDVGEDDANPTDTTPAGSDAHKHGMMVSGIIAANGNEQGVSGIVRRGASILPVKALKDDGKFTAGRVADAIRYADRAGADIANVSLTIGAWTHSVSDALSDSPGLLVIAGAGNDGYDLDWGHREAYPCENNHVNVICVGSHEKNGTASPWSNHGGEVDLAAPGAEIKTTGFSGYLTESGTSLAAPHVAGVAALLYGMNDWLAPADRVGVLGARGALLNSVSHEGSLVDRVWTHGRLDAFEALRLLKLQRPGVTTSATADQVDQLWAVVGGTIAHRGINMTHIGVQYRVKGKPETMDDVWTIKTRDQLDSVDGKVGFSLSFLQPGTTYEYRLVALNPYGTEDGSPWRTFTTKTPAGELGGPGGVTNPPKPTH